ncbi:DapH/DapD/GlmU-related protein [Catenisphaera adipataccumulans]|uniref:Acetyltransferase-like isoleucine patch superfamily enzyme n=1 Tax=Catenisphaera adipataccumulans TaxID=700500 RepID=A0A7W8CW10_9FIRM|nr:DapH/DapD/GlmU-related protein [Catenisphaera adipataccumulans]MBB5182623.1 acetyltransferase-like isoleucine patch superfamily enzyme [Catenisphaera adipataccumulans]
MQEEVFKKLKSGQPVDMLSEEYKPAIAELHRADTALFRLNHAEPRTKEWNNCRNELFQGTISDSVHFMTPIQIDFPMQMTFEGGCFINHHFTAMSIGGITIGDGVQIGPNVTVVTDNHDFKNRAVLRCKPVVIKKNAWIGACVTIMPGVTIGENAVIGGGAVVTKDIPDNAIAAGVPAKIIRKANE